MLPDVEKDQTNAACDASSKQANLLATVSIGSRALRELTQRWMTGAFTDGKALLGALEHAGIPDGDHLRYVALAIRIDAYPEQFRRYGMEGIFEAKQALIAHGERVFENALGAHEDGAYMALLLIRRDFVRVSELHAQFAVLRDEARWRHGFSLTIGIGSHAVRALDVPQSLRNARIATRYAMVFGGGQDIDYESIAMRVGASPEYPASLKAEVLGAIRRGDAAAYEKHLKRYFSLVWSQSVLFGDAAIVHLLVEIYQQLDERDTCDFVGTYQALMGADHFELKLGVLREFGLQNLQRERGGLADKRLEQIQQILQYIDQNYPNPNLSVVSIAEHVGLSQNTIRQLFREHGIASPRDHITDLRMKKACLLLETTSHSAKSIADQVGFIESRYFYSVFKKYTGMTAYEYRTQAGRR